MFQQVFGTMGSPEFVTVENLEQRALPFVLWHGDGHPCAMCMRINTLIGLVLACKSIFTCMYCKTINTCTTRNSALSYSLLLLHTMHIIYWLYYTYLRCVLIDWVVTVKCLLARWLFFSPMSIVSYTTCTILVQLCMGTQWQWQFSNLIAPWNLQWRFLIQVLSDQWKTVEEEYENAYEDNKRTDCKAHNCSVWPLYVLRLCYIWAVSVC